MSGIFLVIAIASAFCWFAWRRYRQGYTLDDSTEVLVIALIGGILGGRIFYVLQNFREYMKYLPYIFRVTDGGYGMIGSVLGVCAISFFPLKKKKMSVFRTWDALVPCILWVTGIARIARANTQEMWYVIAMDLVGFLIVYFLPGTRRGDKVSFTLLWIGFEQMLSSIMGWDPQAKTVFVPSIFIEAMGFLSYILLRFRKRKKPVVLFDLDGTLMDSKPMVEECFRHVFEMYGKLEEFTPQVAGEVFGPPLIDMMKKYFPDQNPDELVEEYRQYQETRSWNGYMLLFEGVEQTLESLKENGFKMAIVSSRLGNSCKLWLTQLHIRQYFNLVLGQDKIEHAKPAPDGLLMACEKLGYGHDSAIYVGDNASDVIAAKRAGMYAVAYVTDSSKLEEVKKAKPNKILNSIPEILEMLKEDHEWTYERK